MSLFVDAKTGRRAPVRTWLPAVTLIALGVGAVAIGLNHLLVPSSVQHDSVALLAGRDYADVQLAAFDRKPLLIHSHAAMGVLFALLAALQFWRGFRNQDLRRHRWIGYVAGVCLLLLPVTAVAATFVYPFSGMAAVWPNLLWMTVITWCVIAAWRAIRRRDVRAHEAWITRATGMTLGITLSRIYQPLLVLGFHMDTHLALAVIFWLGQGEGLILAELWLRRPGGPLARRAPRKAAA
jgi:uncharacterized membrane protein YozB (DUF420 family)